MGTKPARKPLQFHLPGIPWMWPGSCKAAQSEWVSCPACPSPGPQQEAHVKPQLDVPAEPTHREKVPVKPAVTSSDHGAEVEQPSTPTWARPDFRHPDTWPPCRGWLCFMWVSGAVQSVRICEQVSQPPSYWTEAAARPPLNPELTHDTTCLFVQRHRANEKKGLTMRERVPMHPPCCKWLSPSFTNPHSSCRGQGTGDRAQASLLFCFQGGNGGAEGHVMWSCRADRHVRPDLGCVVVRKNGKRLRSCRTHPLLGYLFLWGLLGFHLSNLVRCTQPTTVQARQTSKRGRSVKGDGFSLAPTPVLLLSVTLPQRPDRPCLCGL